MNINAITLCFDTKNIINYIFPYNYIARSKLFLKLINISQGSGLNEVLHIPYTMLSPTLGWHIKLHSIL